MVNLHFLSTYLEENAEKFKDISNQIWEFAEKRFEEVQSAKLLSDFLECEGFHVQRGVADLDTSFIASYGHGSPIVGILCEYDALSELSQQAGVPEETPLTTGGNGHGCGHNLFAGGSVAAAVAMKSFMQEHQMSGTVRLYGCPAEEGGSGKAFMARAGVFDDLDFALAWHPSTMNCVVPFSTLANCQVLFQFKGKSAHSSMSPHLGRSALDAVELMNVGVNYLREHVNANVRISYAITDTGGTSPNVVQAKASVLYLIRANTSEDVVEVYHRVRDVARGAALMTGTDVELVFDKACSSVIPNNTLERVLAGTFVAHEMPSFTDKEVELARKFSHTLPSSAKENELRFLRGLGEEGEKLHDYFLTVDLADKFVPYAPSTYVAPVSTDVGDVSWIVPTAQIYTACWVLGTPGHTWQVVAQGTTSYAHKGMLLAASVLATSAIEIMQNPSLIHEAKRELRQRLAGGSYVCPIPSDVVPAHLRSKFVSVG